MAYKIDNIENFSDKRGWICGQFFPENSLLKNDKLEIKYLNLKPGDKDPEHFHPVGLEVLIIVYGKIKLRLEGVIHQMNSGDFVFQESNTKEELVDVLKDTLVICVRTPSVVGNKKS